MVTFKNVKVGDEFIVLETGANCSGFRRNEIVTLVLLLGEDSNYYSNGRDSFYLDNDKISPITKKLPELWY